jgi:hypothetical protein
MGLERGVAVRSSVSGDLTNTTNTSSNQKRYAQEYLQGLDIFHLWAEEEISSSDKSERVFFLYRGFHGILRADYLEILRAEIDKKRPH